MPPFHKKAFAATSTQLTDGELETPTSNLIDVEKLQYKELTNLTDKKKWMHRFRKAYSEELTPDVETDYSDGVKFVVALFDGKEVGFLRIVDWQDRFSEFTDEQASNISEGYVKSAYQGQGVLRAMIKHALKECCAKSLSLSNDRVAMHGRYYATLGFTHQRNVGTTDCSRLYLTTWEPFVNALLGP